MEEKSEKKGSTNGRDGTTFASSTIRLPNIPFDLTEKHCCFAEPLEPPRPSSREHAGSGSPFLRDYRLAEGGMIRSVRTTLPMKPVGSI